MALKELREERYEKAKSQLRACTKQACAEAAGVSVPTYMKMEEDPGMITRDQAERLARHFGVREAAIFFK